PGQGAGSVMDNDHVAVVSGGSQLSNHGRKPRHHEGRIPAAERRNVKAGAEGLSIAQIGRNRERRRPLKRLRLHHFGWPFRNTLLASTSDASSDMISPAVSIRSRSATRRLAWRRR